MKKIAITIGSLALIPTHMAFAQGVKLLEGIKDIGAGSTPTLGEYITNGYTFAIGAAGVVAVVQLVVAGIEYIYFGFSEGSVSKAKGRATNTLYGLGAVLLSYVILQILNPAIVANGFNNIVVGLDQEIRKVEPVVKNNNNGVGSDTGQGSGSAARDSNGNGIVKPCNDCVNIRTLSNSSIGGNGNTNFDVNRSLGTKLVAMDTALDRENISWRINEAHPPTYLGHKSACHYDGTCIDAGLSSATVTNLNAYVKAASDAGLTAKWETTTAEQTRLRNAGYTGPFGAISSSPHFHVTQ